MCLHIDVMVTRKFIKDNRNKKEITCYKSLNIDAYGLYSLYYFTRYKKGINLSNRKYNYNNLRDDSVYGCLNKGIHVYIDKSKCKKAGRIIVPVLCKLKDLVKCGNDNDAVFMKVRIRKPVYDKICERNR